MITLTRRSSLYLLTSSIRAKFIGGHALNRLEVCLCSEHLDSRVRLERAVLLIKSFRFLKIDAKKTIYLINKIFEFYIHRYEKNSSVIAFELAKYFKTIPVGTEIKLICRLHDIIYGLIWCSSVSTEEMSFFSKSVSPIFLKHINRIESKSKGEYKERGQLIKIGYFSHYTHNHRGNAVGPLIRSIALLHSQFSDRKIYFYCLQWTDEKYLSELERHGVELKRLEQFNAYDRLKNASEIIKNDNLDIVFADIPSAISTFMFSQRIASFQAWIDMGFPYWNNKYLDWTYLFNYEFRDHFDINSQKYSVIKMPKFSLELEGGKASIDNRINKNKKYLGVYSRLIKLSPSFLLLLEVLLRKQNNVHLIIVGTGDSIDVERWIDKNNFNERVIFINENVDLDEYVKITNIFLDTFPFYGGISCREFIKRGVPVVSLAIDDQANFFYRSERLKDLVANTESEYLVIINRLLKDASFYRHCSALSKKLFTKFDHSEFINSLEKPYFNNFL